MFGGFKVFNCVCGYCYLFDFVWVYGILYDVCGKVIVVICFDEVFCFEKILKIGQANGLDGIWMISWEECWEIEFYVSVIKAIWVF